MKRSCTRMILGIFLCIGAAGICFASENDSENTAKPFFQMWPSASGIQLKPAVYGWTEMGQIVNGGQDKRTGVGMDHVWLQRIFIGMAVDAQMTSTAHFAAGTEMKMFNDFPLALNPADVRAVHFYPYLTRSELLWEPICLKDFNLQVEAGYFPFKYNPDVKNLGEYLFRSTAYPQTVSTEFDFPFARLAGLHVSGMPLSGLKIDLLGTFNTEWMAVGDLNLSALASYNLRDIFEVGAGVSFGSVISANEGLTTPHDSNTYYHDTTNNTYGYYTFRGTKLMARLAFYPGALLHCEFLSKEDLKIYFEATVLGLKDYPQPIDTSLVWYGRISQRIPVVAGINIPTFKILDELSLEAEYWGNPFPNTMEYVVGQGLPLPIPAGNKEPVPDTTKYVNDNVKWSVYATKKFSKRFTITGQVASDHMRTFTASAWAQQDWEEALRSPNHWYWMLKLGVGF